MTGSGIGSMRGQIVAITVCGCGDTAIGGSRRLEIRTRCTEGWNVIWIMTVVMINVDFVAKIGRRMRSIDDGNWSIVVGA